MFSRLRSGTPSSIRGRPPVRWFDPRVWPPGRIRRPSCLHVDWGSAPTDHPNHDRTAAGTLGRCADHSHLTFATIVAPPLWENLDRRVGWRENESPFQFSRPDLHFGSVSGRVLDSGRCSVDAERRPDPVTRPTPSRIPLSPNSPRRPTAPERTWVVTTSSRSSGLALLLPPLVGPDS